MYEIRGGNGDIWTVVSTVVSPGHETPVHIALTRKECEDWVAVTLLCELVIEEMSTWDDALQDLITEIVMQVYRLNDLESYDVEDPEGIWMKMENYVLGLVPEGLKKAAAVLEKEFGDKGLGAPPPDPRLHAV